MSKHTPGPWVVYDDHPHDVITNNCAFLVARCSTIVDSDETAANACLIAAAPELLAAARNAALDLRGTPDGDALEAAIAKAEMSEGKA
jgi:hypothetical protein